MVELVKEGLTLGMNPLTLLFDTLIPALEGAAFLVIDLGVNTPPERFVEAIKEYQPQAVGMSAFLTTTMPMFKKNIEAIKAAGLREQVKILVGGAPVTQEYAATVGADGYAPDASWRCA